MLQYIEYVLIALTAAALTLAYLSRRFPHIHWLRAFRVERPYDAERDRELDTAWMPEKERWREELKQRKAERARETPLREMFAAFPKLPPEQREKMRRRSNIIGGIQLIVLGLALPFGYYMLSMMMFFHSVSRTENIVLATASVACVVLGVAGLVRSGRG